VTYGPDYIAQGYVSADWRSAKLMISLFWSFSTLLSAGMFVAEYRSYRQTRRSASVTTTAPIPASPAAGGAV